MEGLHIKSVSKSNSKTYCLHLLWWWHWFIIRFWKLLIHSRNCSFWMLQGWNFKLVSKSNTYTCCLHSKRWWLNWLVVRFWKFKNKKNVEKLLGILFHYHQSKNRVTNTCNKKIFHSFRWGVVHKQRWPIFGLFLTPLPPLVYLIKFIMFI